MAELANSARKLARPLNRVGGSSGETRKNASTVVSAVGYERQRPDEHHQRRDQQSRAAGARAGRGARRGPACGRCVTRSHGQPEALSWFAWLAMFVTACCTVSCPAAAWWMLVCTALLNCTYHGGAPFGNGAWACSRSSASSWAACGDLARLGQQVEAGQPLGSGNAQTTSFGPVQPGPDGLVLGLGEPLDELHRARPRPWPSWGCRCRRGWRRSAQRRARPASGCTAPGSPRWRRTGHVVDGADAAGVVAQLRGDPVLRHLGGEALVVGRRRCCPWAPGRSCRR